ncbi:carbohydrate ABC transporter permease [Gracilinema caldarium]|uniref:carbohydrate ABC transporter permease n=1 Tax=Gracilinema caldarium TaxID=215591 RepID=UPI0026ED60A0|nr:sugar ABC transporter permease [Gracilinema caldarium]
MTLRIHKDRLLPWAFLALPLTMYLIWVIIPVLQSLLFSLTYRDTIMYGQKFIGLANFVRLFQDPQFHLALWNNLIWLVFFVGIPIPLGLGIAMLFNQEYPGARLYKTLFYVPMTLSFAVIGTIWAWIYHPDFGALNTFLRAAHLDSWAKQWLGDKRYMTMALVFVGVWRQVPYVMILYLAGLKNVPEELVEAAMIDGANWGQRFRNVIIPMLAPATVVAVTISIIDSLRSFDIVYVMTNTKARAAEVLASYMYSSAFHYQDYGYGSAIAVIQFLITFGFIVVYVSNTLKNELQR